MSKSWEEELFGLLKSHNIRYLPFVPDAGHAKVLAMAEEDDQITPVVLTTEEKVWHFAVVRGLVANGLYC